MDIPFIEILDGCKKGNKECWERLYGTWCKYIVNWIRRGLIIKDHYVPDANYGPLEEIFSIVIDELYYGINKCEAATEAEFGKWLKNKCIWRVNDWEKKKNKEETAYNSYMEDTLQSLDQSIDEDNEITLKDILQTNLKTEPDYENTLTPKYFDDFSRYIEEEKEPKYQIALKLYFMYEVGYPEAELINEIAKFKNIHVSRVKESIDRFLEQLDLKAEKQDETDRILSNKWIKYLKLINEIKYLEDSISHRMQELDKKKKLLDVLEAEGDLPPDVFPRDPEYLKRRIHEVSFLIKKETSKLDKLEKRQETYENSIKEKRIELHGISIEERKKIKEKGEGKAQYRGIYPSYEDIVNLLGGSINKNALAVKVNRFRKKAEQIFAIYPK